MTTAQQSIHFVSYCLSEAVYNLSLVTIIHCTVLAIITIADHAFCLQWCA